MYVDRDTGKICAKTKPQECHTPTLVSLQHTDVIAVGTIDKNFIPVKLFDMLCSKGVLHE